MELGPRDRLSQAFVHEVEKGRTTDSPYGPIVHLDLRHLGEKLIDTKLPFVRELCLKYERIDPVHELIPVRPVVHYMMGGVSHRHRRGDPARGAVRRGRDRLREHQRGQPARLQLVARVPGVRARAGRAAAEYASAAGRRRPSSRPRRPTRCAAWSATSWARDRAPRASPRSARRCRPRWRRPPASSGRARDGQGRGHPRRAAGARRERRPRGHEPVVQHRAAGRPGAGQHARHRRVHPPGRHAAGGVAGGAPAHRLPGPRRRKLPDPPAGAPQPRRDVAGRAPAGDDHPLAPGRAGLREK